MARLVIEQGVSGKIEVNCEECNQHVHTFNAATVYLEELNEIVHQCPSSYTLSDLSHSHRMSDVDFTKGERGKFYRHGATLSLP